jgi:hypothetical protein
VVVLCPNKLSFWYLCANQYRPTSCNDNILYVYVVSVYYLLYSTCCCCCVVVLIFVDNRWERVVVEVDSECYNYRYNAKSYEYDNNFIVFLFLSRGLNNIWSKIIFRLLYTRCNYFYVSCIIIIGIMQYCCAVCRHFMSDVRVYCLDCL